MKTKSIFFSTAVLLFLPLIGLAGQKYTELSTQMVYDVSQDSNGNIIIQTENPNTQSVWVTTITPSNPKYQYYADKFGLVNDATLADYYVYDHTKAPFLPYYQPFFSPPYNEFSFFTGKQPEIPTSSNKFRGMDGETVPNSTNTR